MQWVVDTWVIAKCADRSSSCSLYCITFLGKILINGQICLDVEGDIYKEYEPYISNDRTNFLQRWWGEMVRHKGKFYNVSKKLDNVHQTKLINNLHFDPSDIKFVGVASKSSGKLIVTGDSDYYREDVCRYLNHNLLLTILCPKPALLFF